MITRRVEQLYGKETTVDRIKDICNRFYADIQSIKATPQEFFDLVRKIPYRRDPKGIDSFGEMEGIEVIARPIILFQNSDLGLDCKKKCILMVAYAIAHKIPWRIVTSSRRPDKQHHHIFPQWCINGVWINADATYRNYKLGQKKELTSFRVY